MVANINTAMTICGTNVHVYSISITNDNPSNRKAYYQHRHPGFEIHYVINGQCKITCSGNAFDLESESVLLIPPGTYHDIVPAKQETSRLCISFSIQTNKGHVGNSKTNVFNSIYSQDIPITASLRNSEAQHILHRMLVLLESTREETYKNDKLLALCASLLLELIPYISDAASDNSALQSVHAQEDVNFLIDSFLGTNFMCNNAKSRMASELYISPRQLQRIIKKHYGMNYRQKLSETRLQIAVDLLCNSEMQIHEIAEILGYSCSANFSAFIKRITGKTPSQIRKER